MPCHTENSRVFAGWLIDAIANSLKICGYDEAEGVSSSCRFLKNVCYTCYRQRAFLLCEHGGVPSKRTFLKRLCHTHHNRKAFPGAPFHAPPKPAPPDSPFQ